MPIYLPTDTMGSAFYGTDELAAIYYGDDLVWQKTAGGAISFLCGFEGADGANTTADFIDESTWAHACSTVNGQAQLDTAQKKFGTSSFLSDGSGDYITFLDHPAFELGAGEWTLEGFIRPSILSRFQGMFGKQSSSTANPACALGLDASNNLFCRMSTTSSGIVTVSGASGFSINNWYHVCADKDASDKVRVYADGVMIASTTVADSIPDTVGSFRVGAWSSGGLVRSFAGWVDEVRLTKGLAHYADDSGFTVPVSAYPRP